MTKNSTKTKTTPNKTKKQINKKVSKTQTNKQSNLQLNLVTGNLNKVKEFKSILGSGFEINNISLSLPELQDNSSISIAKSKAIYAFEQCKQTVIIEDTSLCFKAMNYLPGPYIKDFHSKLKSEGLFKMLEGFNNKTAIAQCIIGFMSPQITEPLVFVGETQGTIVQPRGNHGFGWDDVFQPEGYQQTYAEIDSQTKDQISHRRRAIELFRDYIQKQH